ncbi:PilZ domain-containing protein [Pseudodesulfovibrio sp.]|uniref:PilZ domain-containing protein n=1 Tax=Pseudodesulfovibrio sp. TaxID=2035812 RepID=UPI00260E9F0C|nr:PilZ domain-containing protein [Pseudodesulfovibrio sp.]MDD3310646.1 flagellar brake domain-containing protein [Pseudodesulfovibrio sp.]
MNIASGDKVLMEFSTFGDRFLSIVTDVREDGRLMVYAPLSPPVIARLRTDVSARVRFAHEGRLKGFATRVLNPAAPPGAVLELAPPDGVYDAEDRTEPRCPCRFPALVEAGGRAMRAVVEDMSTSCSRVRFLEDDWGSGESLDDREVRLTFHPFALDQGYSVACDLRAVFHKNGERYAVLGFRSDDAETRRRIDEFVEAQLDCGLPRL